MLRMNLLFWWEENVDVCVDKVFMGVMVIKIDYVNN